MVIFIYFLTLLWVVAPRGCGSFCTRVQTCGPVSQSCFKLNLADAPDRHWWKPEYTEETLADATVPPSAPCVDSLNKSIVALMRTGSLNTLVVSGLYSMLLL